MPMDTIIPQGQFWWSSKDSGVVCDAAGVISDFGTDLVHPSGAGRSVFSAINTPRFINFGPWPGLLIPRSTEIPSGQNAGMRVQLPDPGGGFIFKARPSILFVVAAFCSLAGDNNGTGRLIAGAATQVGFSKVFINTASAAGLRGTAGQTSFNGGASSVNASRVGCGPAVYCIRNSTADGSWGFCNNLASKSALASGSNTQETEFNLGAFLGALNGNNPAWGAMIFEAFGGFWDSRPANNGFNYVDADAVAGMNELKAKYGIEDGQTKVAVFMGDSRGVSGTLLRKVLTTGPGAVNTTLTVQGNPGDTVLTVGSITGWNNGDRITFNNGSDDPLQGAETCKVNLAPSGNTITLAAPGLRKTHPVGTVATNSRFGYTGSFSGPATASKLLGYGSGTHLFNQSQSSQTLGGIPGTATTLGAQANAGATSIQVASTTGIVALEYICLGQGLAGAECVQVSSVTDGTHFALATALVNTHANGQSVQALSKDGTHQALLLTPGTTKTAVGERSTNDFKNATLVDDAAAQAFAATKLVEAESWGKIAKACAGAGETVKVVYKQCGDRVDLTALQRAAMNYFNAALLANANGIFDGIALNHPFENLLANDVNTFTFAGARAATAIYGEMGDTDGIHGSAIVCAGMAVMLDAAINAAWGWTLPYGPAKPRPTATRVGSTVVCRWDAPGAIGSPPRMYNSSGDAHLYIRAVLRLNGVGGTIVNTETPSEVYTESGNVSYVTSFTITNPGAATKVSLEFVDAAGNSSGQQEVAISDLTSGERERGREPDLERIRP